MKKIKIHKNSKRIIILIFALLVTLSGLQLFFALSAPKTSMSESIVYEASCQPSVSYQVIINPNEVIVGTTMEEDKFYSKKILNRIQADFKVDYTGSEAVPLDIEYQIMGEVNGLSGEDTYWSKSFPLAGKKNAKEEKKESYSIKESIQFQLGNYDTFAARAKELTGMNVSNELNVYLTGKIIAHKDGQDLETPFNVSLKIPLLQDVFKVTKSGTDSIENNITNKVEVSAPVDYLRIIPYGALLTLSTLGLIIMMFFTREPNELETLKKKTTEILKNYSSRIIAVHNVPKVNYKLSYRVNSIKDLIKIADEIQKPIFYEIDEDTVVKNYEFHVVENDIHYYLILDSGFAKTSPEPSEIKQSA